MKKTFKLIKKYPGSPRLGTEIVKDDSDYHNFINKDNEAFLVNIIDKFPEFWKEIINMPIETKQTCPPLLITEDNFEIFSIIANEFFCVNTHTLEIFKKERGKDYTFSRNTELNIYFAKEEKAEDYVIMNKPCLSIHDIFPKARKGTRCLPKNLIKVIVRSKIQNNEH